MAKLNNFSKGLSTRLDATLIAPNEARVYTNVDNTGELLTSALAYTTIDIAVASWFYNFKDTWLSGALERDYVEYQRKLYFTEAGTRAKKFDGVTQKNLGITAPTTKLTSVEGAAGSLYGLAMPLPPGIANDVVWSPLGTGFAVAHEVTPFVSIWKQNGPTYEVYDAPTQLPTGKAHGIAYSPDGNYLAVAHETAPYLTVYKINNDTITTIETVIANGKKKATKVTNDKTTSGKKHNTIAAPSTTPTGDGYGVAWSADSVYLAVAHTTTPFLTIYKLASDVLTKLTNPATLPAGNGRGVAFSQDTVYLAVAHTTTPFVTIYKRSGDTFTKLANPATLPAGDALGAGWSADGTYLTIAHNVSPFITVYKRAADVFTKLTDPATLPAGIAHDVCFSPNYDFMSVAHEVTPFITTYSRSGDVFTKVSDPDVLPTGIGNGVSYSNDNSQLIVACAVTPFVVIYDRNSSVFTKFKDPTTLQYVYTFYDSSEGIESAPSPASDDLEIVAGKSVDLSGFRPSSNTSVDKVKLYRIGADVTDFTLLIELAFPTDFSYDLPTDTYSYNDNIPTLSAVGDILDTVNNQPPIDGLINLCEAYGIMFGSIGEKLYYSKTGQPDYWPSAQYFSMSNDVTGILPLPDGIFVFTKTNFEVLVGSTPETFAFLPAKGGHGCNSHKSCKIVQGKPVWSSYDGLCTWSSGAVNVLTKEKLGKTEFSIVNTAVYDETYWMVLTDGSLFAMDFRFGMAFKRIKLDKNVTDMGVFGNILYATIGGKVTTLFNGEPLEFSYLSPELTEGDTAMTKLYNNIYVRANGDFTFTIYVDGVKVSQEDLHGNTIHDVTPPEEKQRGSSIQFGITGIGTVKEIEYKTIGRQNGR